MKRSEGDFTSAAVCASESDSALGHAVGMAVVTYSRSLARKSGELRYLCELILAASESESDPNVRLRTACFAAGLAQEAEALERPLKADVSKRLSIPDQQAVKSALARVLDSSAFAGAARRSSFLRLAVERVLAGDAQSLKAYTIATEAMGRNNDFDPATDATVRVEAVRVRAALARYYEGEGSSDPVVIDMPSGSYVPTFAWRGPKRAA